MDRKDFKPLQWCMDNKYYDIWYIDYGYRHVYYLTGADREIDLFQITSCVELKIELHNDQELYRRFGCGIEKNQNLYMITPQLLDFLFNAMENFKSSEFYKERCRYNG